MWRGRLRRSPPADETEKGMSMGTERERLKEAAEGGISWKAMGSRVVPCQRADHPGAAAVLPVLWRQLQDRMPHRSGTMMNPFEVAREIAQRLTRIFLRD